MHTNNNTECILIINHPFQSFKIVRIVGRGESELVKDRHTTAGTHNSRNSIMSRDVIMCRDTIMNRDAIVSREDANKISNASNSNNSSNSRNASNSRKAGNSTDTAITRMPNPDKLPELTLWSWLTLVYLLNNNSPQEGFVRVSPHKSVRKSSLKLLCTGGNRPQDVSLVLAQNPAVF
jgi:hypothetical protein